MKHYKIKDIENLMKIDGPITSISGPLCTFYFIPKLNIACKNNLHKIYKTYDDQLAALKDLQTVIHEECEKHLEKLDNLHYTLKQINWDCNRLLCKFTEGRIPIYIFINDSNYSVCSIFQIEPKINFIEQTLEDAKRTAEKIWYDYLITFLDEVEY